VYIAEHIDWIWQVFQVRQEQSRKKLVKVERASSLTGDSRQWAPGRD